MNRARHPLVQTAPVNGTKLAKRVTRDPGAGEVQVSAAAPKPAAPMPGPRASLYGPLGGALRPVLGR
jgi:hypothetical protein